MRDIERRKYEMMARVRAFGAANAAAFSAGSKGKELFDELEAVLAELDGHTEAQVSTRSAAAAGTSGRREARERLREHLEAISRTARAMALDSPGADERFRLPRGNNDQALLSTARSFHSGVAPLSAEFTQHELPADFLDTLQAEINNFERAIGGQNNSRQARAAATSAIGEAVERGTAVVKRLDAVMRNKFNGDAARLAAWYAASRTERAPRKTPRPAPPEQPQP